MPTLAEQIAAMNKNKPAQTATAAPAGAAPLGGGNRLTQIKAALAKAKVSSGSRKAMPLGTAWYLLKNAQYKVAESGNVKMTIFSFICLHPICDGTNISPAAASYSGARMHEEFEVPFFHGGKFLDSEMSKNVQALACCMGWTPEYAKQLLTDESGIETVLTMLKALFCVSMDGVPTNEPCAFANQVVIELHTKENRKEAKVDGQPVFDAQGQKVTKTFTNTYWNKKVSIADVLGTVPEAEVIKAFGTSEAVTAAYQAEMQIASLAAGQ